MKKVIGILKALANEKRLKILNTVDKFKHLSVADVAQITRFPYKTVSRHLNKLAHAGLIKLERDKSWARSNLKAGVKKILNVVSAFERRSDKF